MKTTLIALTLTALSSIALTAQADVKTMPQVQEYTYGTRLDIAEVTKTPNLNFCGVRPVDLSYVDHMGKAHTLRYETIGNACLGDN
ncbi:MULTISPECIES: DUF2790 domain-containing protein [unclassified Pseudomonas]|uniref:DUF2790 domain-containing protein n=1 Tax=unclassified Pseudomonas TaxID=196821 RepID=UPI000D3DB3CD|nr:MULTISPECIES: DUF2790 domain-containing protein [unclassified Pseudomonas]RAU45396.1 DUF2790 domain-containing protein [Pseudomonas sp. RIT 409]RAU53220.1 DUF2790 domain-containing protein [Pseudomonas sp. RIT 412]